MNRRLVPMPAASAPPPPESTDDASPHLHALLPFWPPGRIDVLAIATVCLTAVLWNYRYAIILIGAVYFLGRGWFWLGRNYPIVMWFAMGFVRGLFR